MIDTIAFDADDTLWENGPLFSVTQEKFQKLLSNFHTSEWVGQRLYVTEVKNLAHFGYGVKSFTLSMIETAIELTEGRITGIEIQTLIEAAKEMIHAPVRLLDGVEEVVSGLAEDFRLMIITKGDLFVQESKIARSGLDKFFTHVEVVSEKNERSYQAIFNKNKIEPQKFLMVGNSLKSDILPIVGMGSNAVYIPCEATWLHEQVSQNSNEKEYFELTSMRHLPEWLKSFTDRGPKNWLGN